MGSKLKNVANETHKLYDLEYGEKTDKWGKCEAQMEGPGIWRVTLENVQNGKQTLQDLEYGEKTDKGGK